MIIMQVSLSKLCYVRNSEEGLFLQEMQRAIEFSVSCIWEASMWMASECNNYYLRMVLHMYVYNTYVCRQSVQILKQIMSTHSYVQYVCNT